MAHIRRRKGNGSAEDLQKGLQSTKRLRWPYFSRGDAEWRIEVTRWDVVRCHQGQTPPDASCQMPPGARCRQMPVARYQLPDVPPPGPAGGLGEVSRAPVLMSSALISVTCCRRQFWGPLIATMSDVLPPSSLGSHSSRCLLSNGFVPRFPFTNASSRHSPSAAPRSSTWTAASTAFTACGPSVTDLDGCKQTLPAMASGGGGGGGSSGGLDQLLGAINTLLPALHLLFPPPHRPTTESGLAEFGARRGCGCQVASVLKCYIFQYMRIVFRWKKCNWLQSHWISLRITYIELKITLPFKNKG